MLTEFQIESGYMATAQILADAPVERSVGTAVHYKPKSFADRLAFGFTKLLKFCADTFSCETLRSGETSVLGIADPKSFFAILPGDTAHKAASKDKTSRTNSYTNGFV